MKRAIRSYISFTRNERIGIVCLSALIIILLAVRITMVYYVHPKHNTAEEQKLRAAWEVFKRSQPKPVSDSVRNEQATYADKTSEDDAPLPSIININTADSETLIRLKGIGPAMAHKVLVYRKKHLFKRVDELLDVQSIPKETFDVVKKHLAVDSSSEDAK